MRNQFSMSKQSKECSTKQRLSIKAWRNSFLSKDIQRLSNLRIRSLNTSRTPWPSSRWFRSKGKAIRRKLTLAPSIIISGLSQGQLHWNLFGVISWCSRKNGEPLRQPLGDDKFAAREPHPNNCEELNSKAEDGRGMILLSQAVSFSCPVSWKILLEHK